MGGQGEGWRGLIGAALLLVAAGCGRVGYEARTGDGGGGRDGAVDGGIGDGGAIPDAGGPQVGTVDCTCVLGNACAGSWPLIIGESGNVRAASVAVDAAGRVTVAGLFDGVFDPGGVRAVADGFDSFVVSATATGELRWARATDEFGFDQVEQLAVDGAGNVHVAGVMDDTLDLGGELLDATGSPPLDVVAASYDAEGTHRWSVQQGGELAEAASGIAVAPSGSLILGGIVAGESDLGDGVLVYPRAGQDAWVAAYEPGDPSTARWVNVMHGDGETDSVNELAVDGDGNVYVVGAVEGPTDFGAGDVGVAGGADAFLASYDAAGAHRWSLTFGGPGDDAAFGVAARGGAVVVSGFFVGDGAVEGTPLASSGSGDWFVVSFDAASGALRWARTFGGADSDQAWHVDIDGEGNAFVSGWLNGTVEIEGVALASEGMRDVLVASLTPAGEVRWARRMGGPGDDIGLGLAVGDGVYLSGMFDGTASFGCAERTAPPGTSLGYLLRLAR